MVVTFHYKKEFHLVIIETINLRRKTEGLGQARKQNNNKTLRLKGLMVKSLILSKVLLRKYFVLLEPK